MSQEGNSLVPTHTPLDIGAQDVSRYPLAIQQAFARNLEMSRSFISPKAIQERSDWIEGHCCRLSGDFCIDGRVSDGSAALGIPLGLFEMYRSRGCQDNSFASRIYLQRLRDANEKYRSQRIKGLPRPQTEIRLVTAHYSSSRRSDHSCAAWDHDTDRAVSAMKFHAERLNQKLPGTMVAIPARIDTDTDGFEFIGPGGEIHVRNFAESADLQNGTLRSALVDELRRAFPSSWEPLMRLGYPEHQQAFYMELAERLEANVHFYRNVKRSKGPIELLEHQERLIRIGRPLDAYRHNEAFLIEDREAEANFANLRIGLRYVGVNVLHDAIRDNDINWRIPILVSLPYGEGTHDKGLAMADAEHIVYGDASHPRLQMRIHEAADAIVRSIKGELKKHYESLPAFITEGLDNIEERISWCITVASRTDRRFQLVE